MKTEPQPADPSLNHSTDPLRNEQRELTHSYLLRLWLSTEKGSWRASLQSVRTGERHMFADLESLLAFLVDQSLS